MRLPGFEQSEKTAWLPPKVPLGVAIAQSMSFPPTTYANAEWWKGMEERSRQQREENERVARFYEGETK